MDREDTDNRDEGDKPDNETEEECPADKAGVPVVALEEGHAEVEEDDAVTVEEGEEGME